MNREDIIRMADKAGFETCSGDGWPNEWLLSNIEKFASLVAAAEREECAKMCEDLTLAHPGRADLTADQCAAAIRARGKE
jgi:hypothetical protein